MRFGLSAVFSVVLMVQMAPVRASKNCETKVCNQCIGQGRITRKAIKELDEKLSKKLDQLIKLLQPSASPGKMRLLIAFNFYDLLMLPLLINECKEMAGKSNQDDYGNENANTLGFMNKLIALHVHHTFWCLLLQDTKEKRQWVPFK